MATKKQIIKLMAVMSLAYPGFQIKDGQAELYFQMLSDIDDGLLETASKHLITTSKFFPSISEWRNAAFDLAIDRAHIPTQFEAWNNACQVMRRWGIYKGAPPTDEYSHPLVAKAVYVIGYNNLYNSNWTDFDRSNFYKVYESLTTRASEDIRMLPDVKAASGQLAGVIKQLAETLTRKD